MARGRGAGRGHGRSECGRAARGLAVPTAVRTAALWWPKQQLESYTRRLRLNHPACHDQALCEGAPKSMINFRIILWQNNHTHFLLQRKHRERPVQPGRGVLLVFLSVCYCVYDRLLSAAYCCVCDSGVWGV
jgi:hypothetical protein